MIFPSIKQIKCSSGDILFFILPKPYTMTILIELHIFDWLMHFIVFIVIICMNFSSWVMKCCSIDVLMYRLSLWNATVDVFNAFQGIECVWWAWHPSQRNPRGPEVSRFPGAGRIEVPQLLCTVGPKWSEW